MAQFTQIGVEAVVKGQRKFLSDLGKLSKGVAGVGAKLAKFAVAGVAAAGAAVVGLGVVSIKTAIEFESAWAGVIKTTDDVIDEFGNLTEGGRELQEGFRQLAMEVPTAVEELLAIGEIGGQLGIARDDLIEFTRTVADLGETTSLTREAAATDLARIATVMGTTARLGVEGFSRMGSAIVELGNNFETSETEVLAFAQRIAGAGVIAGLTEADIFAIGAAMSSVGVQAEAGGTAVQKVLLAMNEAVISNSDQLEIFAATAGVSAQEFATAWETDAGGAFNDFVVGLGLAGDDALGVLDALDLKDQRLIRSFLSLASAGDKLENAMELSSSAFQENIALAKEAEIRYRTTESQFKIFKNTIKDLFITIGSALLPVLNELLVLAKPLIAEFAKKLPGFMKTKLIPVIRLVVKWLGDNLPKAIKIVSKLWTGTLKPALETVTKFITGTVIPIVQKIFSFFQDEGPAAMAETTGFIQGTLIPIFKKIADFITGTVIPAITKLVNFLVNTFRPIIQKVIDFALTEFQKFADWFQTILPLIQDALQEVADFINSILTTIVNFWNTHGEEIIRIVSMWLNQVKTNIENILEVIRNVIELVLNIITGNWNDAWENVKTIVITIWDSIRGSIESAFNVIKGIIGIILAEININWSSIWNAIKTFAATIWEGIRTIISTLINAIATLISIVLNGIKTTWETIWHGIKTFVETTWENIKTFISNTINNILAIIEEVMSNIKSMMEQLWTDVKNAVVAKWEEIKATVASGLANILSQLANALGGFVNAGRAIVDSIKQGISNAWAGLQNWFSNRLSDLTNALPWNSPPIDPESPLQGLRRSGRNIVEEIGAGMRDAMPDLQAQLSAAVTIPQVAAGAVAPAATSSRAPINLSFDTTIQTGMEQAVFEERVRQIVTDAVD